MSICVKCRGRKFLCGLSKCPVVDRLRVYTIAWRYAARGEVYGSTPPAAVVGESGWPRVRVYIGEPPGVFGQEARRYDAPDALWGLSLEEITRLRSFLVFGVKTVSRPWDLGDLAYAAVSSSPVDVEMKLSKTPSLELRFDLFEKPMGPRAPLERVRVVGNPSIYPKLDRIIHDDVKARDAVVELYKWGVDIYTIQRAMSLGLLGRQRRRRLVPTRWSITAVDTIVGDWLAQRVKYLDEVVEVLYGYGEYLDNSYLVIVAPGPLKFVYLERWVSSSDVTEVFVKEDLRGRRSLLDGGFEAARVAVLEKLKAAGRRGTVAIVRKIGPGYYTSVGNWQIRETVRRIVLKPLDEQYGEYVKKVGVDPLGLIKREGRLI
ncbi:MAG: hypothetical protein QXT46_04600 [Pyrobaculum sp.]